MTLSFYHFNFLIDSVNDGYAVVGKSWFVLNN